MSDPSEGDQAPDDMSPEADSAPGEQKRSEVDSLDASQVSRDGSFGTPAQGNDSDKNDGRGGDGGGIDDDRRDQEAAGAEEGEEVPAELDRRPSIPPISDELIVELQEETQRLTEKYAIGADAEGKSRTIVDHTPKGDSDPALLFEWEMEDSETPYYLEGNPAFNRPKYTRMRRELENDDRVQRSIGHFWQLYRVSRPESDQGSGEAGGEKAESEAQSQPDAVDTPSLESESENEYITQDAYLEVYTIMAKALSGGTLSEARIKSCAGHDWERDTNWGTKFTTDEHGLVLTKKQWRHSMFEIADQWTHTVHPDEYVLFLSRLFARITREVGEDDEKTGEDNGKDGTADDVDIDEDIDEDASGSDDEDNPGGKKPGESDSDDDDKNQDDSKKKPEGGEDANGDGKSDGDGDAENENPPVEIDPELALMRKVLDRWQLAVTAWRIMDTDHNGKINQAEFFRGLRSSGLGDLTLEEMQSLFTRIDSDHSGSIEYAELERLLWEAAHPGEKRHIPQTRDQQDSSLRRSRVRDRSQSRPRGRSRSRSKARSRSRSARRSRSRGKGSRQSSRPARPAHQSTEGPVKNVDDIGAGANPLAPDPTAKEAENSGTQVPQTKTPDAANEQQEQEVAGPENEDAPQDANHEDKKAEESRPDENISNEASSETPEAASKLDASKDTSEEVTAAVEDQTAKVDAKSTAPIEPSPSKLDTKTSQKAAKPIKTPKKKSKSSPTKRPVSRSKGSPSTKASPGRKSTKSSPRSPVSPASRPGTSKGSSRSSQKKKNRTSSASTSKRASRTEASPTPAESAPPTKPGSRGKRRLRASPKGGRASRTNTRRTKGRASPKGGRASPTLPRSSPTHALSSNSKSLAAALIEMPEMDPMATLGPSSSRSRTESLEVSLSAYVDDTSARGEDEAFAKLRVAVLGEPGDETIRRTFTRALGRKTGLQVLSGAVGESSVRTETLRCAQRGAGFVLNGAPSNSDMLSNLGGPKSFDALVLIGENGSEARAGVETAFATSPRRIIRLNAQSADDSPEQSEDVRRGVVKVMSRLNMLRRRRQQEELVLRKAIDNMTQEVQHHRQRRRIETGVSSLGRALRPAKDTGLSGMEKWERMAMLDRNMLSLPRDRRLALLQLKELEIKSRIDAVRMRRRKNVIQRHADTILRQERAAAAREKGRELANRMQLALQDRVVARLEKAKARREQERRAMGRSVPRPASPPVAVPALLSPSLLQSPSQAAPLARPQMTRAQMARPMRLRPATAGALARPQQFTVAVPTGAERLDRRLVRSGVVGRDAGVAPATPGSRHLVLNKSNQFELRVRAPNRDASLELASGQISANFPSSDTRRPGYPIPAYPQRPMRAHRPRSAIILPSGAEDSGATRRAPPARLGDWLNAFAEYRGSVESKDAGANKESTVVARDGPPPNRRLAAYRGHRPLQDTRRRQSADGQNAEMGEEPLNDDNLSDLLSSGQPELQPRIELPREGRPVRSPSAGARRRRRGRRVEGGQPVVVRSERRLRPKSAAPRSRSVFRPSTLDLSARAEGRIAQQPGRQQTADAGFSDGVGALSARSRGTDANHDADRVRVVVRPPAALGSARRPQSGATHERPQTGTSQGTIYPWQPASQLGPDAPPLEPAPDHRGFSSKFAYRPIRRLSARGDRPDNGLTPQNGSASSGRVPLPRAAPRLGPASPGIQIRKTMARRPPVDPNYEVDIGEGLLPQGLGDSDPKPWEADNMPPNSKAKPLPRQGAQRRGDAAESKGATQDPVDEVGPMDKMRALSGEAIRLLTAYSRDSARTGSVGSRSRPTTRGSERYWRRKLERKGTSHDSQPDTGSLAWQLREHYGLAQGELKTATTRSSTYRRRNTRGKARERAARIKAREPLKGSTFEWDAVAKAAAEAIERERELGAVDRLARPHTSAATAMFRSPHRLPPSNNQEYVLRARLQSPGKPTKPRPRGARPGSAASTQSVQSFCRDVPKHPFYPGLLASPNIPSKVRPKPVILDDTDERLRFMTRPRTREQRLRHMYTDKTSYPYVVMNDYATKAVKGKQFARRGRADAGRRTKSKGMGKKTGTKSGIWGYYY